MSPILIRASMDEKSYYLCCMIEGRERTVELPPRKGPFTMEEAEALRKKLTTGRRHSRTLRYRILDSKNNKIVK